MKKRSFCYWMLFMGIVVGVLSGCEKIVDDKKEDNRQPVGQYVNTIENNVDNENIENYSEETSGMGIEADTSETLNTNVSTVLAKDVFSTITGISQEWQDGLFIVNGMDMSGKKICGIMNRMGEIELFDEYSTLYPLEGDCMIASIDEEVTGDILTEWRGIPGKIINKNKDVIYEPSEEDPFQRMYVINSSNIFIISAAPGFVGVSVEWGVMDHNGKWVYTLNKFESKKTEDYLKQAIKIDKDGRRWNFDIIRLDRSKQEGSDSKALIVGVLGEGEWVYFIYWTDDEKLFEYDLNGVTIYGNACEFGENSLLFASILGDYLFDKNGNIEELELELGAAKCICVTHDNAYFENAVGEFYDISGRKITFPDNFNDICIRRKLYNEVLFFNLRGADNNEYMAITDLEGKLIEEPFLIQGSAEVSDVRGDYLVYAEDYFSSQGAPSLDSDIHIVNYNTKEDITITKKFVAVRGVVFLGEDLFAFYWEENNVKHYEVYDILGNRIC